MVICRKHVLNILPTVEELVCVCVCVLPTRRPAAVHVTGRMADKFSAKLAESAGPRLIGRTDRTRRTQEAAAEEEPPTRVIGGVGGALHDKCSIALYHNSTLIFT